MRPNIKLSLFQLLPTALLTLFNHVIGKLTGNPLFPNTPLTIPEMTTLSNELKTTIDNAIGGSIEARELRNNKVKEVRDVLRVTADYVRAQCDGDAAKLASSGFELAKQPEPITVVGIPGNLRASASDTTGSILLRWGKTEGARMFKLERAISDPTLGETTWVTMGQSTRQRFVAVGLEPYKAYWFRVIAVGKDKEGIPSDVVIGRAA
jgi:hypothetical protein